MVEIVVKVPKEYVDDAEDFGMLDPETIAQVLREALDERIMKFVDAEVKAHRADQRAKRAADQED
jgi:hypothetical protein